jgi:hypothetical protein
MWIEGSVIEWRAEEGWGVIAAPDTPEQANQDGYLFRAAHFRARLRCS